MRHRVVKKTLGRNKDQRKALISNLAAQLIEQGSINTTLAKAKVVKPYVEKLVTKAIKANKSENNLIKFNTVKLLRKHLRSEKSIRSLMDNVAPKFLNRKGGYTRIIKTGNRSGDNAILARIEFVESISKGKELKERKEKKENTNKTKVVKKTKAKPTEKKEVKVDKAEKKNEKNTK